VAVENLAPGAQTVLSAAWNTAATFAGNYEVYGRLLDSQGRLVAEAVSPFAVVAPAQLAASSVTTDKPVYQAWDAVQIDGRVRNARTMRCWRRRGSRSRSAVRMAAFCTSIPGRSNELVPGGLVDVPFNLMLSDADAGVYPGRAGAEGRIQPGAVERQRHQFPGAAQRIAGGPGAGHSQRADDLSGRSKLLC